MTLPSGSRLGPYEILSPLGSGGMGEVYRALDTRLAREVAIKVPPEELARDPAAIARFEREARAVASLAHPNVLDIHDFGHEGDVWYAVTELLSGETLRRRLADGPMPWREAVAIAVQVAEGLGAAHERGVVHRDIKPENVFLTREGRVKILDFGLARVTPEPGAASAGATRSGTVLGTAAYMSPEQVRGEAVDARTDIFSFGSLLYEMLTGEPAFHAATPPETMVAILRDPSPDPARRAAEMPEALRRIVGRCLEKSAGRRTQAARDLARELEDLLAEAAPAPARPTADLERANPRRRIRRIAALVAAAAGAAALARIGIDRASRLDSVAVLPFVNVRGGENAQYLAEGLTESLIHRLSRLPGLRVPARTTVFAHRAGEDPRETGRTLGVAAVVDGKISRLGDDLVLDVELVEVARGTRLWGERFERKAGELVALQEEVAREIAERLRRRLTGAEVAALARRVTEDPVAYDLYLQGRYHWNKRGGEDLSRAIALFEQVIARDDRFAAAHAALAQAYDLVAFYGAEPPVQVLPRAREQATRALELDDTLAEAHAALADVRYQFEWDWAAAEAGFRQALMLDPGSALARQWYSNFLSVSGRFDESFREIEAARRLDPMDLMIRTDEGLAQHWAGQDDRARALLESTLALEPAFPLTHMYLGLVEARRGAFDTALEQAAIARRQLPDEPDPIALYGYACARAGRREEAREAMRQLEELGRRRFVDAIPVSVLWIGLSEPDRAFAWLDRALADRSGRLVYLKVEKAFDPIRSDPRFAALIAKLRFPR